ncbi:hypothetical protein KR009_004458 [Drosophila setifemur]|nr:hypothetical protein KR009_004458 [Drosophila setifemur]
MKNKHLYLLLFNVIVLLNFSEGRVFRVTKIVCQTFDPSFVYFKKCKVERNESGRALIYISQIVLYKEPMDDIILNLGLFKISKNRRYQFLNETLDYCAFSKQMLEAKGVMGFMIHPFLSISNMNSTCPLKVRNLMSLVFKSPNINLVKYQQRDVIFDGFPIDENTLKEIPIPNGVYMFHVRAAALKKWRTSVKAYVNRVEKYS